LRLDEIQADIEQNERHLAIARRSHRLAQRHLRERLVALYVEGGRGGDDFSGIIRLLAGR
jgi:hypothetical protein